jgi:hypothetical protein
MTWRNVPILCILYYVLRIKVKSQVVFIDIFSIIIIVTIVVIGNQDGKIHIILIN